MSQIKNNLNYSKTDQGMVVTMPKNLKVVTEREFKSNELNISIEII